MFIIDMNFIKNLWKDVVVGKIMFFCRFLMRFILMIDVIMFFSMLNILFSFKVSNIRKNNMDYIGVVGSWLMVFVKVMKVSLVLDLF